MTTFVDLLAVATCLTGVPDAGKTTFFLGAGAAGLITQRARLQPALESLGCALRIRALQVGAQRCAE